MNSKTNLLALIGLLFLASCNAKTYSHSRYNIDKAFADKYNIEVPLEFTYAIDYEHKGYANPKTLAKMGSPYGVSSYAFFAGKEKKKVKEDVLLIKGKLGSDSSEEKLVYLDNVCKAKKHLAAFMGQATCSEAQSNRIKINKYNTLRCQVACDVKGKKVIKSNHFVLHPDSKNLVHIDATYYPAVSDVKTIADIQTKGLKGGVAYLLKTFEFGKVVSKD